MTRTRQSVPLPVVLLVAAFLCPTEFSVYIAGLRIPPHRAALLVILPIAVWKLIRQRGLKIRSYDAVFALFNIWTVAIFSYHHTDYVGLIYGGSLALDGFGAYLVARVWIRDHNTALAALKVLGFAAMFAAALALPETLLGQNFTHDFLRDITGYVHPTAIEKRLGLTRAYGSFDHPIHYGTFCAALLALYWYAATSAAERHKRGALIVGATLLGLSSAPILCLMLQAAMLVWERLTRGMANRTSITLTILAGLYIGAACVMTRSPINFIATGMTLDSWTGYYRLQIWENGLISVYANSWTGIGLNDWQRPWWMASPTVDAFWLVIAMREGIPAIVLLVGAIVLITRDVYRRGLSHPDPAVRRLARGWCMSLLALSLVGATVHYWNVLYAYFFFFVGLAGWISDPLRKSLSKRSRTRGAATPTGGPRGIGARPGYGGPADPVIDLPAMA